MGQILQLSKQIASNFKDISGQRFGRLTVLQQTCVKNSHAVWLCLCDCGNKKEISGHRLRNKTTCSCGCLWFEAMAIAGKKRMGTKSPRYNHGLSFGQKENRWSIVCRDGSKVLYSRAIWEGETGIKIPKGAVIHHINHDSSFDEIQNLAMFFSQSAHVKYHRGIAL